ncbi:hypothetical protein HDV06_004006 [Boothiomyces sp. JEL0866]|nr:hypothetical protein HDV06_004006 [Boothiomyces sp. JEL0866]
MQDIYETLTSVKNNSKQSLYLLNSLITGYCLTGKFDKVFSIFDSVYKSPKHKLKMDVAAFSFFGQDLLINIFGVTPITVCGLLDSCGYEKDYQKLKHYWNMFQKDQFPLVKNNYCSFVEALVRCGKEKEAFNVIEKLEFKDEKIHKHFVAMCRDKKLKERIEKKYGVVADEKIRNRLILLPPIPDFVE